jgi:hypothetical protein
MTCTANGIAESGQYTNTGSATGTPPAGPDVTDDDPSHYFGASPAIRLEKLTNLADADVPSGPYIASGGVVLWLYLVANTGNVPLTDIVVTDSDPAVQVTCPPRDVLLPGTFMLCRAIATADVDEYENMGTVTANSISGVPVEDGDPSHYFGTQTGIDLEKATNGEDADTPPGPDIGVGDPVTWTYVVTNTSNVTITSIQVTDDQLGPITCPQSELAVGESMTCTATGVAEPGQYSNTAQVIGLPPAGVEVFDEDPSHYFGSDPTGLGPINQPDADTNLYMPKVER